MREETKTHEEEPRVLIESPRAAAGKKEMHNPKRNAQKRPHALGSSKEGPITLQGFRKAIGGRGPRGRGGGGKPWGVEEGLAGGGGKGKETLHGYYRGGGVVGKTDSQDERKILV